MSKALKYSDVYLVPRYSELRSRSEADISVEFLGRKLAAPFLPANMQSVVNEQLAHWLSENDLPYIFHRFGDTKTFVERANRENWKLISISVGVKEQDRELLRWIVANQLRVDWICVDIAHGHSVLMKEMIEFIRGLEFKSKMGEYASRVSGVDIAEYRINIDAGRNWGMESESYRPKIIAGNVATPEGVKDLILWGADCCKCGIAGGAACSTKVNTGFHVPMFTCALDCSDEILQNYYDFERFGSTGRVPLIFDGGIRESGDIAKALVAGGGKPNLVMIGSMLAACVNAPGENVYEIAREWTNEITAEEGGGYPSTGVYAWKERKTDKITHKRYWGSASSRQKGEKKYEEGFEVDLPCNGRTYSELYREIRESLQSAISYAGGRDISAFAGVQWMEVS